MSNSIDFTKSLIKGKITEIIFQRMFLESGEFKVFPLGYEYTVPELALHEHRNPLVKKITENLRNTPDFALISNHNDDVFLVEVKYRHKFDQQENKTIAEDIYKRYTISHLFLATPEAFYFDSTKEIKDSGAMNPLPISWVNLDLQNKYLELLKEFLIASH